MFERRGSEDYSKRLKVMVSVVKRKNTSEQSPSMCQVLQEGNGKFRAF